MIEAGVNRVGVKICGLSDAACFDAAIACGADWLGLVFFDRSPRAVTAARAAALSARHPPSAAARVGLFVRASDAQIADVLDHLPLDALQIYDSAERARAVRARFGLPVWLACPVREPADLMLHPIGVDRLLIEPPPPPRADRPGGNGAALDGSMLRGWRAPHPWLLAGGLDEGNVAEAIRRSGAVAVDVSSGVETAPGRKDPALIAAFIQAARGHVDPGKLRFAESNA